MLGLLLKLLNSWLDKMTESGNIHFRIATWFEEDDVVLGDRTFHRETRRDNL